MLDPLGAIVRTESNNRNVRNYRYDSGHTAQGYAQITNSTWRGIPSSITGGYATAEEAPRNVQLAGAAYLYNRRGFSDWAPYNDKLRTEVRQAGGKDAYQAPGTLSENPADYGSYETGSGAPLTSGDDGSGIGFSADAPKSSGGAATTNEPADFGGGSDTGAGTGTGSGTGTGTGTASGGGLPAIAAYGWDKAVRFFLILLGVVLVAIAAWAVAKGELKV